jgi:hypothetical protein
MGDTIRVGIPPVITGPDAPVKGERPPSAPVGERPSYIPEKFWKDGKVDVEGLSKSYAELEKSRNRVVEPPKSGGEQKPKEPAQGEQPKPGGEQPKPGGEQKPKEPAQGEQITIPGVSPEQTTKYWEELSKGNLSEASYGELAKAGYPKVMVDAYIRGLQADQAEGVNFAADVKKIAGGEDGYAVMADWMANNMPAEEVAEYNKVMNSGNKLAIKAAIESVHQRYTKDTGTPPNLLGGGNTPQAGDVFRSQSEITAAMRDPRYKRDAAYRADVMEKIKRSQ